MFRSKLHLWSTPTFATLATLALSETALGQDFEVRRSADDSVALSGQVSDELTDPATATLVRLADFSELDEPGEYYLAVAGVGRSVSFRVGDDVYDTELVNVMRGFYGWRSGIDISFDHAGRHYEHAAGHLDDALLDFIDGQTGVTKDGAGGWYDAGDFGKYLPTASVSVNSMLAAWELFSDRLADVELPFIPEHGSELPDFLSELKWELDWLLKMQYDDASGRVHHKIHSPSFPSLEVLPADDPSTRYFATFSTAATGEFVATMAKAARAFEPYDDVTDGYSETLLDAAWTAYEYLRDHPEDVQYNYAEIPAGEYRKVDISDRVWAAAELWETTGDSNVLADFEGRILSTTHFIPNFDWDTTTNFGLLAYALSKREGRDPAIADQLEQALIAAADDISEVQRANGYGRGYSGFYWGTNGVVARLCLLLQSAYSLDRQQRYLDACSAQIGYLYGRNQYNRSQVTGSGIEPPLNPHHRASVSDDVDLPYPGLLVGGGISATAWRDVQADARNNEVAINWNSALVFALAGFATGNNADSDGSDGSDNPDGVGAIAAEACGVRLNSLGFLPSHQKVATIVDDCALPTNFECAMGPNTMSGEIDGSGSVIDNLDDEDLQILPSDSREGSWFAYDDNSGGERTDIEIEAAADDGNGGASGADNAGDTDGSAACIRGKDFLQWGGGMGFSLSQPNGSRQSYDASAYTGLSFRAKGSDDVEFRALLVDGYSDPTAGQCAGCNDHFRVLFTPGSHWKQYSFAWADFEQQGFGDQQPSVCPSALRAIQFQWPRQADFELCVDDIAFASSPSDDPQAWQAMGGGGCTLAPARRSAPGAPPLVAATLLLGAALRRRRRQLLSKL